MFKVKIVGMIYHSKTAYGRSGLSNTMSPKWRMGVALLAITIATGCASTPVEEATLSQIPGSFTETASTAGDDQSAALTANWLTILQDPALEALVGEAMAHNNNLGAAAERLNAARQGAYAVRAGLLPSLNANISSTRTASPELPPAGNRNYNTAYGFTPSLSWEADIWARLTDRTRAAYLDARSSQADYDAARLSIAGAVAQGWYGLVAARLQRELAERDVATGEANLRITTRRYERGISSPLDVRLARSSLATSRALLLTRERVEKESARRLELLLGRYPSAELAAAANLPDLSSLSGEDGTVRGIGTPQQVLTRRPDLIAAEASMRSAGLNASAARKALLPSLRLTASGNGSSANFSDIFDIDALAGTLLTSIAQPIFQGGALRANAKGAAARARASAYAYAQTVLNAYSEIENALMNEGILEAREEALHIAYEEAVATEELTQRQYINGTTNIFNLINAQQRRILAESQYIDSKSARLSNRIGLYMALGGNFSIDGQDSQNSSANQNKPRNLFRRWWRADISPFEETKTSSASLIASTFAENTAAAKAAPETIRGNLGLGDTP